MDYPYVNIHTHSRTGEGIEVVSSMALAGVLPQPPCTVGIHPWQVGKIDTDMALREVETASVSAIGEIGLDFVKSNDRGLQKMALAAQLRIAEERGLPVVIHCVKAFEPLVEILREYNLPAVIFHGFVGSDPQVRRALEAGYYISLGERSLGSAKTVEALRSVPVERLFLETDESGTGIREIYSEASRLSPELTVADLKRILYANYKSIFER